MNKLLVFLLFIGPGLAFASTECSFETCAVTEKTFNQSIRKLKSLYPTIKFHSEWKDNSIQAAARFQQIFLSGGFARKKGITLGGFITVACHEVGHALLSLSEGEADYFASSDCMKKYFQNDNNDRVVSTYPSLSFDIEQACDNHFSSRNEVALCTRIAISSKNAANLGRKRCQKRVIDLESQVLSSRSSRYSVSNFYMRCLRTNSQITNDNILRRELLDIINGVSLELDEEIDYMANDERVVKATYHSHNSPKCRMQTLRHGNLRQPKPTCWFKN